MNKIKSVILSIVAALMLSALMLTACGDDTDRSTENSEIGTAGLKYTLLNDGTYSVSIGKAVYSYEIVIPPTYNGRAVTQIAAGGFSQTEELYSIEIPSSIVKIGADAFKGSDSIETLLIGDLEAWCKIDFENRYSNPLLYAVEFYIDEVSGEDLVIPEGTEYIGEYAFAGSSVIKSVVLPDSLVSIGNFAFSSCPNLRTFTLGENVRKIGSETFEGSYALSYTEIEGVYYLGNAENPYLALIAAKQKVHSGVGLEIILCDVNEKTLAIADGAFDGCDDLIDLRMGKSVQNIGARAFSGCESLETVYISDMSAWCKIDFDGYYANPLFYAKEGLYLNSSRVETLDTEREHITSIGEYAFHNYSALTSVRLHDGVEKIGTHAFSYCTNLKDITLGKGITHIPERAFDNCVSIENIDLGNIKTIAPFAFYYCTGLKELHLPLVENVGESAFYGSSGIRTVIFGNNTKIIETSAFNRCTGIDKLVLSDALENIGYRAFYNCQGLMSIRLPMALSNIGDEAFYGCYKLLEIINNSPLQITPKSGACGAVALYAEEVHSGQSKVENINGFYFYSFGGVNYLLGVAGSPETIVLPDEGYKGNQYIIWDYAFANNNTLTDVTISNLAVSIGNSAFVSCLALKNVTMGDGIVSIGENAFADCISIEELLIGSSVKTIGRAAFARCTGLTRLTLSDSTEIVGKEAFYKCSALVSVAVGENIKEFGFAAFDDCASLSKVEITNIAGWCEVSFDSKHANPLYYSEGFSTDGSLVTVLTVPEGVTQISAYAFFGVKELVSITLPKTLKSIGNDAFKGCSRLVEIINHSDDQAFKESLVIGSFANGFIAECALIIHNGDSVMENKDGFVFMSADGATYLVAYLGEEKDIILPLDHNGSAYSIYNYAFANSKITSIVIPEGIKSIGDYAFFECKEIEEISIPYSVTRVGSHAFAMCEKLAKVTVGSVVEGVLKSKAEFIGESAFKGNKNMVEFNMGEGVGIIGSSAFFGCFSPEDSSLDCSITIPHSVNEIGSYAFADCTQLKRIIFLRVDGWHYLINEGYRDYILKDPDSYTLGENLFERTDMVANSLKGGYKEYIIARLKP